MIFRVLCVIIFLGVTVDLSGQSNLILNNVAPKIKWYQINTPNFKIIYPEGFSKQGQRMANTMEHIYQPASASLGVSPRKNFPLILQNHTTVSNGFVTLGPRRSEFYTMSPQRPALLGNNDWLDMLALHEFRHVVQFDRSRTGLTGFLRNIFGEYTQAAVASATVPSWFWEGDAVLIETALSKSGRGRIPEFSALFRANLLENGSYNYNKAYLRSYKDFIPNHYVLGYHYANFLRQQYGSENVENMVARTWAQPYIPFSFSFAQKKFGGKKMPEMYQDLMTDLGKKWQQQQDELRLTAYEVVNTKPKKVFTRYDYPQFLDNGNLVVLKTGLGDYPQLIEVDVESGKESKIFVPGLINSANMLSANSGSIVWNEYQFDPRWRQQTYTVVKLYQPGSGTLRQLSSKTRYNAASISPNREMVATIEQKEDYTNSLVVLDAFSGEVEYRFDWSVGLALTNPVWSDNENILVAEVNRGTKRLIELNINNGQVRELLAPTTEQISYAFRKDDNLFYVSGLTGIDNIYVKDLTDNTKYQVTSSKFGAYSPVLSPDGSMLYYNELNSMGTDIARTQLTPANWIDLKDLTYTDVELNDNIVDQEGNAQILESVPEKEYPEARYRKKLAKLHSWGPYLSSSAYELEAGLYSTNLLSTTDLFVGFRADTDLNFKWIGRASFQALYPIIDVEASFAKRNQINFVDTAASPDERKIVEDQINWNETGVKAGIRLPWLLTSSKFHTNIEVRNYFGYTAINSFQSTFFGDTRYRFNQLSNGNLLNNEFRFTFSSLLARSKRDINSKWGAVLLFENYGTPYGGDYKGGLTALRGIFYFPGLAKHHSLNFMAGYQHLNITLDNNNYWFANRMPYPRGVRGFTFEDFYTVRSNYDLPILYPDLSIGPWVYIQRIKAQLFFDYGYGNTDVLNNDLGRQLQFSQNYYSTGAELTFDFNFMRALPIAELGVRYFYLPDQRTGGFEFLVGSFGF